MSVSSALHYRNVARLQDRMHSLSDLTMLDTNVQAAQNIEGPDLNSNLDTNEAR